MAEVNRWNVIFLLDKNPPTKIVLLKRSAEKTFAPNFFTGIGGKIGDLPGLEEETVLGSAYRELKEETKNYLTKENTQLREFARCIYDSGLILYYFYGLYTSNSTPNIDPKDGTLVWAKTSDLLQKEFIPTTGAICKEWAKRGFAVNKPFTVYVEETGQGRTVRLIRALGVEEGLQ